MEAPLAGTVEHINSVGAELRRTLLPVLTAVAGPHPSPTRLARAIGLDKSLASRLVRATQSRSDLDLMHIVPSPAGLRILADLAGILAPASAIADLLTVTERFAVLLESTAGGRAAIDALISESSPDVREKREHIAKQASFKAMSFLLGHFCDMLTTSLFLVPSVDGKRIDGIEVHRRIGLRRMRPSTPLALLSFSVPPEEQPKDSAIWFDTVDGEPVGDPAASYLMPEFSSQPMPRLEVVQDNNVTTLVLPGNTGAPTPSEITSTFRIRNAWSRQPESGMQSLRGYVLHVPCVQLVRDVYVAEPLFPDASPRVSFLMPGPRVVTRPPVENGQRHFTEVDLTSTLEQLPAGPHAYSVPGVGDQAAAVRHALERAGHGQTRFRGWRCSITYPVPLIEMMWWLHHPGLGNGA
jgi:hypothetical protein